jgi:hypothetical protein
MRLVLINTKTLNREMEKKVVGNKMDWSSKLKLQLRKEGYDAIMTHFPGNKTNLCSNSIK